MAASHLPRLLSNHPFSAPDLDLTYRSRFLLHDSSNAIGLSGLLVLPQPKSKPEPEPEPRKLCRNGGLILGISEIGDLWFVIVVTVGDRVWEGGLVVVIGAWRWWQQWWRW
ncbi:hypothetical protein RHGRI_037170 [Rhododendron griersonianum]|uniref:Uncharacterized protein n=1 Tax=Rhododendron griersonianum TaxID=479676 RepID=A0AAV6HQR4_9ERIC|nr:hypothetical protein RHGRI_037170 [Rhododendron griersonianum]